MTLDKEGKIMVRHYEKRMINRIKHNLPKEGIVEEIEEIIGKLFKILELTKENGNLKGDK